MRPLGQLNQHAVVVHDHIAALHHVLVPLVPRHKLIFNLFYTLNFLEYLHHILLRIVKHFRSQQQFKASVDHFCILLGLLVMILDCFPGLLQKKVLH